MGQFSSYQPATPSDDQIARLTHRLLGVSERMTDGQILEVADALHDRLRERRELRGRSHRRMDERLHHGSLNLMI